MGTKYGIKCFGVVADTVSVEVKYKIGVVVFVTKPETDGYIFSLEEAEEVEEATIIIEIDPYINVFGFSVDGNKNITPAKNYSQVGRVYRKKVPIHIPVHKGKDPYTQYNENHIRLLELGHNGRFAIREVAIVFQNGLGFLTTQKVYEGSVFQSGKGLFCPEFDGKWPQLISFLESIYKQNGIGNLPCFEGYNPFKKVDDIFNLDDGVGVVRWYNIAQGFGAISTNKGDAFVHYKDIDLPERLVCLDVGDMVLFEKLIPNTSDQGGFSYKAVGVLAPEA